MPLKIRDTQERKIMWPEKIINVRENQTSSRVLSVFMWNIYSQRKFPFLEKFSITEKIKQMNTQLAKENKQSNINMPQNITQQRNQDENKN